MWLVRILSQTVMSIMVVVASHAEFFLTVENTLDSIEFEDTSKKEMVKPGQYVGQFELLSYLREMV